MKRRWKRSTHGCGRQHSTAPVGSLWSGGLLPNADLLNHFFQLTAEDSSVVAIKRDVELVALLASIDRIGTPLDFAQVARRMREHRLRHEPCGN